MKRLLFICFIWIFVGILSGCVSVKSIPYEITVRPPKPENYPIEIYESKDISTPCKVIGIIQVDAGRRHSVANVIEKLRARARLMGGDALIDLTNQPIGAGFPTKSGGTVYSGHVRELWQAKVIVWESPNQKL